MKMVVHSAAQAELRKSRRWYEKRQPGVGLELLGDVRGALHRIQDDPEIGVRFLGTECRFYKTKRFPFVIYYVELSDHICVMAIAHNRRRPGFWRRRKPE